MTESDKDSLRQMKARVSEELSSGRASLLDGHAEALEADARIGTYLDGVMRNPEAHNLYELLGVRRFFSLLDRWRWDSGKVRRFFRFYESLRFSGIVGRTRYSLTPVQCFIFGSIFGLRDFRGLRLTRTAYLFVPRKFAKTTSVAALAIYDLLFGDNNAQAYIGANSYDQAKICFDEIRSIMRDIDPGEKHLRVNREKINFRNGERASLIQCLSSNATTKDGLNASLVIMDEYAQARNTAGKDGAALKNVLTTSMGARSEPLTVVTTTASDVVDGPFAHELEGVLRVLRGETVSDSMFAAVFMPDVDDDEGDPATWRKVQPHIGVTVREDFYAGEWEKAQLSAENMVAFRTKLLNVFAVAERRSWISPELVKSLMRPMRLEDFVGRPPAMCAIDLSESDDFSAVTFGIYDAKGRSYAFHTSYFFPEGALSGHPNEALYRVWVEQGHLTLTPGDVIDYRMIVEFILHANRHLCILLIGYDPWKSQEVVNMLSAAGAKNVLRPVRQTYGYFTAPVESFEHGAKTGKVWMNDNPINAFCFGNAVLDEDKLENVKPVRRSLFMKIDGVITALMCMRLFIDYEG